MVAKRNLPLVSSEVLTIEPLSIGDTRVGFSLTSFGLITLRKHIRHSQTIPHQVQKNDAHLTQLPKVVVLTSSNIESNNPETICTTPPIVAAEHNYNRKTRVPKLAQKLN